VSITELVVAPAPNVSPAAPSVASQPLVCTISCASVLAVVPDATVMVPVRSEPRFAV
jgi:hypothetical protein